MRPDERLPTKRTASIGSRVPPAEMSTRLPRSGPLPGEQILGGAHDVLRLGHPSDAELALRRLALVGADEHDAARTQRLGIRARRRHATTCAGSSPARRASGRDARAPLRSGRCRRARARASRACSRCTARRRAGRRGSDGDRRPPPGGRRASARNVSAVTKRSAPGVTSGTTSCPAFTSRRQTSHAL